VVTVQRVSKLQCPRTFSTDVNILFCKLLEEAALLGLQEPSRPWGPPIRRHLPHDAEQLKRQQCQLPHGHMALLLAALRIDRDDPALCGIVETRIEHKKLLRLLDLHGVIIDQHLDSLGPESPIHIEAKVVEPNLPILADLVCQLAEPEDPAQTHRVNGVPLSLPQDDLG
jgi:hypothetical protein